MGEYIWKLTQKELHHKMNFAYEQGIANERERIIGLVEHWLVNDEQHIPRLCGGCDFIALIKGENE
jgi:hypothetical protein